MQLTVFDNLIKKFSIKLAIWHIQLFCQASNILGRLLACMLIAFYTVLVTIWTISYCRLFPQKIPYLRF